MSKAARKSPRCWTLKQIADDMQVSLRTVARWIASGALIVHRVDKVVRVADADYRQFLNDHRDD